MKVLDLKLQAFGPFLKEQHIDFTLLNDKGMFLINGPTGTGKTSLFDAIVFALYGKGSGSDREDSKSLRSDFAKDDTITYVELVFEANGKVYKIRRQPPYTRKAKKGTGDTLEQAKVELYMPDGTVLTKIKEVDEKIVNEILFINRAQFKTVALLAQGEFTELITADSKQRALILEHIFQKEIYDSFQTKITELCKESERELDSIKSSLETLINKVEGGEAVAGYQDALDDPSYVPAFLNNLKELVIQLENEVNEKHKEVEKAHTDYQDSASRLKNLQTSNEQIEKYLKSLQKLDELKEKEQSINSLKVFMETLIEIDSLEPLFNQLNNLNGIIENSSKNIKNANEKLKEVEENKKWITDNKASYEANKERVVKLTSIISSLNKIVEDRKTLKDEKDEIEENTNKYEKQVLENQQKEKEFLDLKARFFASSSYNLAQQLEDGKPCPVCGSVHHPQKAHATNPVSEKEYKNAEKENQNRANDLVKFKNQLDSDKASFETKETNLINSLKESGFTEADNTFLYSKELDKKIKDLKDEQVNKNMHITAYEGKDRQTSIDESKYKQIIASAESLIVSTNETLKEVQKSITEKLDANTHIKTSEDYFANKELADNSDLTVDEIKQQIEEYNNEKISANAIVKNTPKELIERGSVDEASLVEETNGKKAIYDELNAKENSLKNQIANLKKDIKTIKDKYDDCKAIISKCTSLTELAKTANGANRMKLSFKMYILADYFDKILIHANHRLLKISNGRFKLIRRNALGKGAAQQGLDLDVFDAETGKDRAASSLSGGEKFVSALSLALGLSDIIETGKALIQVESIFIDEGFGTLDENYLDTAMKALETLKTENKTIAIISHVEKLKVYINDFIEVKKCDVGSTAVIKNNF